MTVTLLSVFIYGAGSVLAGNRIPDSSTDPDTTALNRSLRNRLAAGDSLGETGSIFLDPSLVREAYSRNGSRALFLGTAEGRRCANGFLDWLEHVAEEGLDPGRYQAALLDSTIATLPDLTPGWWDRVTQMGGAGERSASMARADLLLTDRYLAAALDLHGLTRADSAGVDTLLAALSNPAPIERNEPAHPQYRALKTALAAYRQAAREGGWPAIDDGPKLVKGNRGKRVGQLRARLDAEARLLAARQVPVADTLAGGTVADPLVFDQVLKQRVALFQRLHALDDDGVAGKGTLAELNITAPQRVMQLERNLARWRHDPGAEPDPRVEVIIPGMWLDYVEGGRKAMRLRTVVGSGRKSAEWLGKSSIAETPELVDEIETVEVNPKWHIPEIIVRTELLAKEKKEPGYLDKGGFEWYEPGTGKSGPASELPESTWTNTKKRLYLRQRSGDENALGRIKFLFPNPYAVYLHDTPDKKYFRRGRRAFSHGCIRVENPAALAETLFARTSTPPRKSLKEMLRTDKLVSVGIHPPMPIHLLYRTAWVEDDGTIRFLPDLYNRDASFDSLRVVVAGGWGGMTQGLAVNAVHRSTR